MTLTQRFYMRLFDKFARSTVNAGFLRFVLPNGAELTYGSDAPESTAAPVPAGEEWRGRPALKATVRIFNMEFFYKIIVKTDTGLGEAYMDGDFEVRI